MAVLVADLRIGEGGIGYSRICNEVLLPLAKTSVPLDLGRHPDNMSSCSSNFGAPQQKRLSLAPSLTSVSVGT